MLGRMRIVNPDRGTALAASVGRLLATSVDEGRRWEVRLVLKGREFFTRRLLEQAELRAIASGQAGPEPWHWSWRAEGQAGTIRLRPHRWPTRDEFVQLGYEALRAATHPELPLIDPFEVWLCDRETAAPLALGATAISLEMAMATPHLGAWQCVEFPRQIPETWAFQNALNARLNQSSREGRYRFRVRVYERTAHGVIRHGLKGISKWEQPGVLPDGLLAEPWDSERRALLQLLESREGRSTEPERLVSRFPSQTSRAVTAGVVHLGSISVTPPMASGALG